MSNPRYTAVESQATTSPLNRCAKAIPSALLPVAVGPTIATSHGRLLTGRGGRGRTPGPPAPPAPPAIRSAASGSARSSRARIFVEVERHGEERAVVRVLVRQRLGRVRRGERVERGVVERLDARGAQHFQLRDATVLPDVERDHHVPAEKHRGLRHEPVAPDLRDEAAQPRPELDPFRVELDRRREVLAPALQVPEAVLLDVLLRVADRPAKPAPGGA